MNLREYLSIMLLATLLCWVSWSIVLFNIDPFQTGNMGFLFFYGTLFFALSGTISLIEVLIQYRFGDNTIPLYQYVKKSFRDGIFGALLLICLLYLQGERLLTLWNLFVFLLAILFCAIFIKATHRNSSS